MDNESRDEYIKRIYQAHRETLRKYIQHNTTGNHDDVEDVLSEVFKRAWHYLPDCPDESIANEVGWLYKIAQRECQRFNQRMTIERNMTDSMVSDEEEVSPLEERIVDRGRQPEEEVEQRELMDLLYRRIDELPTEIRQVVVLHYIEEKPYEEIAKFIGKSSSTAKRRAQKGLEHLRVRLVHEQ